MKRVLTVSFAYLAAIIGAGFASGSEIISYFIRYGKFSILGIITTSVGFGLFAFIVMYGCMRMNVFSCDEYLDKIMRPWQKKIISVLLFVFMEIVLACMISAFAHSMYEIYNNLRLWSIAISIACFILFLFPIEKIARISGIGGIFITFGIIFSCIYLINFRCTNVFSNAVNIQVSALSYVGYNFLSVCPMLVGMSKIFKTKKECFYSSLIIIAFTFMILSLIWCILSVYYNKIELGTIPMLTIARRQGNIFYLWYGSILIMSIITTAICNCYGIVESLSRITKKRIFNSFICISIAYFISGIGFNTIVSTLYRCIGFASIFLFFFIIKNFLNILIKGDIYRKKENKIEF